MKRYGRNTEKFRIEDDRHSGIPGTSKHFTKGHKEEVRNANRSLKKCERQSIKNELREFKF